MKIISIIAAGKGSRFSTIQPKPLAILENNLTTVEFIITNSLLVYDKVLVVIPQNPKFDFLLQKYSNVDFLVQKNPDGNLNAVLMALNHALKFRKLDTFTVQWSDQPFYFYSDYNKLLNTNLNTLIPALIKVNPYVLFNFNGKYLDTIIESKNEKLNNNIGIQDGGIFTFKNETIYLLHKVLLKQHEMQSFRGMNFIYALEKLGLSYNNFDFTFSWYSFISYNTIAEFEYVKTVYKILLK